MLPARDESGSLPGVVGAALAELNRRALLGEVIVVDDGSAVPVVETLRPVDPRVRVVRRRDTPGYGAALRAGFSLARGEHVLYTDADGQFDLVDLARLEPYASEFDLVIGYRSPRADPWPRRVSGWVWSRGIGLALNLGVRDLDCAFKLIRRSVLSRLRLRSRGAFLSAELLAGARRLGASVAEVPVPHHRRRTGEASGGRPDVILRAVRDVARLGPGLRVPVRAAVD